MQRSVSQRKIWILLAGGFSIGVAAVLALVFYRAALGETPVLGSLYQEEPPLVTGPAGSIAGSPILILLNPDPEDPFDAYLGELLRAEGLNLFDMALTSQADLDLFKAYDILLLAEGPVSTSLAADLGSYVAQGGALVAMRPGPELAALQGVAHRSETISEGYLLLDETHPLTEGVAEPRMRFHGVADRVEPQTAEVVAWLHSVEAESEQFPAITLNRYGKGLVVGWTYDLARSIAYMRQGNPALVGADLGEWDGRRAVNMFTGGWIDLDLLEIPEADEQQRLLANQLSALSAGKRPLPRLWYFPGEERGMFIATGDSHINPAAAIEESLSIVERYGGHMTVYYTPLLVSDPGRAGRRVRSWLTDHVPVLGNLMSRVFAAPTPEQVADWRARGHEFGLHPYVEGGIEAGWNRFWREFTGRGFGPVSSTARTHRVLVDGWVETARIQAEYGIRMNFDYYHWGYLFQDESGEWVFGHFTGSSLPMKFVDEQGRILDIYQQLTQLADDHMVNLHWGSIAGLSLEDVKGVSRRLLEDGIDRYPSVIVAQFHVDPFEFGDETAANERAYMESTLEAARDLGYPIWTAEHWARFTEMRHDAEFTEVHWDEPSGRLTFRLNASPESYEVLSAMVPAVYGGAEIEAVYVDGATVEVTSQRVGGVDYGRFVVPPGSHSLEAVYGGSR